MVIALVLVVLAVAGALMYVSLYNKLVRQVNAVESAWGQVDVQLKRRVDLVPNLVETVQGYAAHESETLSAVTAARGAAAGAQGPAAAAQADGMLTQALGRLFAVAEAYPDLKASAQFSELQRELAATEDKVAYARQHYNAAVQDLNTSTEVFPASLVAGSKARFARREYFEVDDAADREAPKVQF